MCFTALKSIFFRNIKISQYFINGEKNSVYTGGNHCLYHLCRRIDALGVKIAKTCSFNLTSASTIQGRRISKNYKANRLLQQDFASRESSRWYKAFHRLLYIITFSQRKVQCKKKITKFPLS
jgi:hypothetical protein